MGQSRTRVLVSVAFCSLLLSFIFAPLSVHAQGNLLANPSFEEGSHVYNNDGDQRVPNSWSPWWASPPKNDCYNFKPHYELEQHPPHVRDGSTSARYFTSYSSHNGGLMQTVGASPGARYRFSIWGLAWSTENPVVDTPSTSTSKLWVGIDPTGGTSGTSKNVVWSQEYGQMDTFGYFQVEAVAQASQITVFTRARPDWCEARNDSFWDAATLVRVGAGGSPIVPTQTPRPPQAPPTQPPSVAPTGVTARANTTLNMRNGPTIYNEIIGYVPDGAVVSVLGRDGGGTQWIYIDRNGTRGWVAGWLTTITGDLNSVPLVQQNGAPWSPSNPPPTPPPTTPNNPPSNPPPAGSVTATPNVNVNMRSGPSITNSVVATAYRGVTLPIVARDASSTWLLLNRNGIQGWVAAWLCSVSGDLNSVPISVGGVSTPPTNPNSGGGAGGAVTAVANLTMNIRSGPSINHAVIGYVPGGTTVTVIGRADDSQWIKIDRNGTQGWVAGWLCTITGNLNSLPVSGHTGTASVSDGAAQALTVAAVTAVSGYQLNMRAEPDLASQTVATVPPNTVLTVTGRDYGTNWLQVSYNGAQGWIARWLVTTTGYLVDLPVVTGTTAPTQPPAATPQAGAGGVTATAGLNMNVRSAPTFNASVIATFYAGTTAEVVGRADDSQWIQIKVQSTTGWVAGWLCTISGDLNSVPVTGHSGTSTTPSSPPPSGPSAPPAGPPPGPENFGLGGQVPDAINHADYMRVARMGWTKMQLVWSPGMDPSEAVGKISLAHANGFKILLSITGGTYPSSIDFPAYVNFVRGVAGYGPDAIEIWNEMNLNREWPSGQINPASYVSNMLAPSYNAIKGVNPNILVISGALAPTGANDGYSVWADDFYLAKMRDAGAASYMDCVGVHHNAGATSPDFNFGHPADPGPHHYSWYYQLTYNLYASTFPTKKLCFTELGYLSPEGFGPLSANFWWGANTSVAMQAAWLARATQLARQSGRVRLVIVFNVDFTSYGDDPQAGYAIVRPDNTCPACSTLAGVMQ